jgi:hypothetical protein
LQVVEHQKDTDPLLAAEPPDEPEDPMFVGQVEAGIGLIEKQVALRSIGRGLSDLRDLHHHRRPRSEVAIPSVEGLRTTILKI